MGEHERAQAERTPSEGSEVLAGADRLHRTGRVSK